jgi:hypothetical protein
MWSEENDVKTELWIEARIYRVRILAGLQAIMTASHQPRHVNAEIYLQIAIHEQYRILHTLT